MFISLITTTTTGGGKLIRYTIGIQSIQQTRNDYGAELEIIAEIDATH
ncbi:hypothetical protein [Pedobacter deserti]|nr:hypothetical protein [Pedobacter sp. SYSU D00382]